MGFAEENQMRWAECLWCVVRRKAACSGWELRRADTGDGCKSFSFDFGEK